MMTEIYKFFNSSTQQVRSYQATDFSSYFSQFLSNGLIHKDNVPFIKVQTDGIELKTTVTPGSAVIKGHLYENTEDLYLQHDIADENFDRIDRVVIRYDNKPENRHIKVFILKGQPSLLPQAPVLTRDEEVYELSLAQIRIPSKSTVVMTEHITDERFNKNLCGLVSSLISIPLEKLEENFNEFKSQINDDLYTRFNELKQEVEVTNLKQEIELVKKNQIELFTQRYLEGKAGTTGAGYFYDILKDTSKIDLNNTTAQIDTDKMEIQMSGANLTDQVTWKPHPIGFVANKVKHYHTRPTGKLVKVTENALSGQNKIKVSNVNITVTEVNA
ncbi:hypothetical protein [Bacillus badius]|uniref:hypothetical protein n=1 Tax=Bacillus badius TaxID=1455 RepID=UPI0012E066B7|nr:hypothetical protein [Bacillus badius]